METEGNKSLNFHSKIKIRASFSSWDSETSLGNEECNHARQENSKNLVVHSLSYDYLRAIVKNC